MEVQGVASFERDLTAASTIAVRARPWIASGKYMIFTVIRKGFGAEIAPRRMGRRE
jgi:hypothetical protein